MIADFDLTDAKTFCKTASNIALQKLKQKRYED